MNPQLLSKNTKEQINEAIFSIIEGIFEKSSIPKDLIPAFSTEIPSNPKNGDFSSNAALITAKTLKSPPRGIAEDIISAIDDEFKQTLSIKKVEIAGAGFINFFMSENWYNECVNTILEIGDNYGKINPENKKRILLEFVSANPTGPMHIGNARGGALGDCLASLLQFAGHYVEREFYVNDAGNQIEKFATSLDVRYRQELGEDIPFPEDAYKGEDIIIHVKNFIKLNGDRFLIVSEDERKKALVEYALPLNIKSLEEDLAKYRIKYDTWFKESELHNNGEVERIIELLKKSGQTYEKDGALWLKTTEFGDEKDRVLIRANGVVTYFVPDIAYHYNKLVTRNFDTAIDILGADHHGYIPRMNAALSALGIDSSRLNMIIMQMVRLVRNGETVKQSKRSGKAITLTTLLDEVPVDAARFLFNLRDANTHLDLDLDLAIEETSKNPVYYVQYAHARIKSVVKRLVDEGVIIKKPDVLSFTTPNELILIKKLYSFPDEIREAAQNLEPSRLTRYVTETAQLFHKFYDTCRVKGESDIVMQSRVALMEAVAIVIRNALEIMKVKAPDKM